MAKEKYGKENLNINCFIGDLMQEIDLIIENANELVTIHSKKGYKTREEMNELGIKNNGSVAVKNGKIVAVGEKSEIKNEINISTDTIIIDATGKTVIPGFVDPHTHLVFGGSREFELDLKIRGATYMEILEKGGGIYYSVEQTRKASKESLIKQVKDRLKTMLRFGTTTIEAKSGYGLNLDNEIKMLEVVKELKSFSIDIVPTFLGAHVVPKEFENRNDDYVDLVVNKMIPTIAKKKLAEFCDVFCEKGVFSIEDSRRILLEGRKYDLKPKIHADEFARFGGTELAGEVKAVSADHLLNASDEGINSLAENKVPAVLLPAVPFCLMQNDYVRARKMIDEGVIVALATDLNPNCYTESMQFIIQLACLKMKMTPQEALVASTINASHAINRSHEIGSLEVGKKADFLILNSKNHKFLPYHFGVNIVDKVFKEGVLVCDNSRSIV